MLGRQKRWLTRAFHFMSGVFYALLAYYAATLVLGSSSAGSGGSGGSGGGSSAGWSSS